MSNERTDNLTDIDTLIKQKLPFAVYRTPGEKEARLILQTTGKVRQIDDLKKLDEESGFVIAPFHADESCPIVLIHPDEEKLITLAEKPNPEKKEDDTPQAEDEKIKNSTPLQDYASCFQTFMEALHTPSFQKLVLSRRLIEQRQPLFSPLTAFRKACRRYIHSYVYLCYTPQTGMWLGSTPEIILSGGKGNWHTVALAGTQPLQNGELPQTWDDKQKQEQEYVASYIRNQLLSLGIHATESKPYPAYAGALSHLKTDFRFSQNGSRKPGELLKVLHPTPAVCGLPKEEAYRFILEHEKYHRNYYSGFIGRLQPDKQTDLYVNLRCMHITDQDLTLYAGGGLLSSSELNDEWQETERKLQTMKQIIVEYP